MIRCQDQTYYGQAKVWFWSEQAANQGKLSGKITTATFNWLNFIT